MIVGSDGKASPTAARAGIRRQGWRYGQTALVCAIAHELPHNGVAHQFFMPAGPLAILPLPGNRSSIVWSETEANAARIQAMDDEAYLEVLRPRFGDFLGEISLAGKRWTYPLALSMTQSLVGPRLALLGDAAHAMHPIAGQGLNAGLKDVAALAEVWPRRAAGARISGGPRCSSATSAGGGSTRRRSFSRRMRSTGSSRTTTRSCGWRATSGWGR
jgi:2-octaprenyl-6-methoxyphenol hydroxylase